MRILCVHPGADNSVSDVYDGLVPALQARGAECIPYALNVRIARAGSWLYWAWKKAGKPDPRPTFADIVYQGSTGIIERALRLQPDWVLVFSAMYVHPDVLIMLKRAGVRVALLLTESPYETDGEMRLLEHADLAWTMERSCVEPYRQVNPNTFYLPHAYDPQKHCPSAVGEADASLPAHDVVFVGTGFQERIDVLSRVDWTGIDFGLYGSWDLLGSRHRLRKYLRGGVQDNRVTAALYRRAKIGLNLYRSSVGYGPAAPRITHAESLNPRALELAATRCFQVSDARSEVFERFGWTVPTFSSAAELEDLVHYWLPNDVEAARESCALEAQQRVAGQTFSARAEQVLEDLEMATLQLAA